jgi:hypothetical protein
MKLNDTRDVIITTTIGKLPKTVVKVDVNPKVNFSSVLDAISKHLPYPDRVGASKLTWYVPSETRLEMCEKIAKLLESSGFKVYRQYPKGSGWEQVENFLNVV